MRHSDLFPFPEPYPWLRFRPPLIPRGSAPSIYPCYFSLRSINNIILQLLVYISFRGKPCGAQWHIPERFPVTSTRYVERNTRALLTYDIFLSKNPCLPPPAQAFEKSSRKAPCGATWNSLQHQAQSITLVWVFTRGLKRWRYCTVSSTRLHTRIPYNVQYMSPR